MRILYVSQYFPPEMGAPAARVSELSRYWAEAGHQVTVLTGFPNHPDGVIRPEYRRHFRKLIFRENMGGVGVVRSWLLPFPNRQPLERILNYSSFCASAAIAGSLLDRPDVVIATSPQLLVGLSGWWIAKLKRVPFVLEVRDLWPESLTAVGIGDSRSSLHRALSSIAAFLYRKADRIVVVSPAFQQRLEKDWLVSKSKISTVQNGVETELFCPQKNSGGLRASLGLEGKFVVSYIGTLGLAHGLTTIIEAAEILRYRAPDVVFLVVGEGADRQRILRLADEKKLTNIYFQPQQPRERVPAYISASDACLVLLKKSDVFETVIPTKMLEFMSCARPVILGVNGQARAILEGCRGGVYVEPESASELCAAIEQLRREPLRQDFMGRSGHEYIVQNLSRKRTALDYISVLKNVLGETANFRKAAA